MLSCVALTMPTVCLSSWCPAVQSGAHSYECHASPKNDTIPMHQSHSLTSQCVLTICHAQTQVVHLLPIIERILHCATIAIDVRRVIVVLEEVPHEVLGPTLCLEERAEHEAMDDAPEECVQEVERKDPVCGYTGTEDERGTVADCEYEFEVGGTARRLQVRRQLSGGHARRCTGGGRG